MTMRNTTLFLFGFLLVACARGGGADVNVKDGAFATSTDAASAYAVFLNESCTGFVVGRRHVVTAGHCLKDRGSVGGSFVNPAGKWHSYSAQQALVHRNYANGSSPDSDIALIVTSRDIEGSKAIALADHAFVEANRKSVLNFAGYGMDENEKLGKLKIADSKLGWTVEGIAGVRLIQSAYGNGSLCPGDSGGPAALNGRLVGVAIRSLDMGVARECALADRVTHVYVPDYLAWISDGFRALGAPLEMTQNPGPEPGPQPNPSPEPQPAPEPTETPQPEEQDVCRQVPKSAGRWVCIGTSPTCGFNDVDGCYTLQTGF